MSNLILSYDREKKFVYKLFVINYFKFYFIVYVKTANPPEKGHPLFPATPL